MVSTGDFVFFPNKRYHSHDRVKGNRWWPKCWVARVLDTRYEDHHNLCLLRLYIATVNKIKHASKGIFYAPTNHTFKMHGRVLLGPIRLREVPSINAWELIDDTSVENDKLHEWTPMPISSVMPSFEQCVMTLASRADTTFVFRILLNFHNKAKQHNPTKERRAQDVVTSLRDALELEGSKYVVMDTKSIQYSGTLKSLPRKFRSSVLSQIKYIQPGSMLESYGIRAFVPRTSIQKDPDTENMTLQELSQRMLERLISQKSASAFEEFAMATILSAEQPDVERATFQSDTNQSNTQFSDADAMIPTFPLGSFVYCANPQYEPDGEMRDTVLQSSPFILGSIEEHRMGVYKLKVFRRQSDTSSEYVETEDHVVVQEMALKPVPNFVSDFQGKWHCMDELNPLVFAIDKTSCGSDSVIDTKTSVQSGSRLKVGPSVMESHTASHIEGSASFKLSTR